MLSYVRHWILKLNSHGVKKFAVPIENPKKSNGIYIDSQKRVMGIASIHSGNVTYFNWISHWISLYQNVSNLIMASFLHGSYDHEHYVTTRRISQPQFSCVTCLRSVKILNILQGNVAGSGGYYIAAPATKIVANPATITGSIGVVTGKFNLDAPARYELSFYSAILPLILDLTMSYALQSNESQTAMHIGR